LNQKSKMIDLSSLTIAKAHTSIKNGDFSASDLTKSYLEKIKNDDLNAFINISEDLALKQSKESDERYANGKELGVLDGIPISIKDTILVEGEKVTAGSKILENYVATYDATAVKRLRDAGAVILGKTNCDEFAMGASNETSAYGPVKNPLDENRVAGGSGGGSAAAVGADLSLVALGSDTGGSVRQPGSFCGVVGFRPTYDVISRNGLIAMASSLDQIGTNTKTVEDSEILFNSMIGKDPMDSTNEDHGHKDSSTVPNGDITIGVPMDMPTEGVDKRVLENFEESKKKLEDMGYKTKEIKLPHAKYGVSCYYILMPAEASSNLARYDGVKYGLHVDGQEDLMSDYLESRGSGFGKEVRRRIILGTYVLSAGYYDSYYGKALMVREMVRKEFEEAFKNVDAIIMPTTTGPAFKIGEKTKDPISMYLEDLYTIPSVLAGVPAISVPSGTVEEDGKNLPLGFQIMAPRFREDICFKVGKDFENNIK